MIHQKKNIVKIITERLDFRHTLGLFSVVKDRLCICIGNHPETHERSQTTGLLRYLSYPTSHVSEIKLCNLFSKMKPINLIFSVNNVKKLVKGLSRGLSNYKQHIINCQLRHFLLMLAKGQYHHFRHLRNKHESMTYQLSFNPVFKQN